MSRFKLPIPILDMNTIARALTISTFCLLLAAGNSRGEVKREPAFTTVDGEAVEAFTITNSKSLKAKIITWGATLVEMWVPGRTGKMGDITLGFDALERYSRPHPFFGSIAGRYANRIGKGRFTLDGKAYTLATNNGPNHLHGGLRGFDKRVWKAEVKDEHSVRFSYTSADGEEGYPGKLEVAVTYTLGENNELRLDYEATTDKPTVLNLTNHTYWNLAGSGDVLNHGLRLYASRFTAVDAGLIPTGELSPVAETALDFTKAKHIGRDIAQLKKEGLPGGYDHNFVIDVNTPGALTPAAEVYDPSSGRMMRVMTTEPGVQFYTANHLKDVPGKNGEIYGTHSGLCLETQHYPDSPNHADFPSTVLRPGETFKSKTIFAFSAY
jgi:aldose 1-epimerase